MAIDVFNDLITDHMDDVRVLEDHFGGDPLSANLHSVRRIPIHPIAADERTGVTLGPGNGPKQPSASAVIADFIRIQRIDVDRDHIAAVADKCVVHNDGL